MSVKHLWKQIQEVILTVHKERRRIEADKGDRETCHCILFMILDFQMNYELASLKKINKWVA